MSVYQDNTACHKLTLLSSPASSQYQQSQTFELKTMVHCVCQEHSQHAAETKVLKHIGTTLDELHDGISKTYQGVEAVGGASACDTVSWSGPA